MQLFKAFPKAWATNLLECFLQIPLGAYLQLLRTNPRINLAPTTDQNTHTCQGTEQRIRALISMPYWRLRSLSLSTDTREKS